MAHADDDGLILPPRIAPIQIVILPVTPKPDTREAVIDACEALAQTLRAQKFHDAPIQVTVDRRDIAGGQRNWEWIKKGVPMRVEIGPRDIENRSVVVTRRDRGPKEKEFISKEEFIREVAERLQDIQDSLLSRATAHRNEHLVRLENEAAFREYFTPMNEDKPETHGGFALMHWAGSSEDEDRIQKELKVTIRCIPFGEEFAEEGVCFITGKPSKRRVVFAKAY
jgi:prolyl-tRNA synthetase